jgi:hypothetical protein
LALRKCSKKALGLLDVWLDARGLRSANVCEPMLHADEVVDVVRKLNLLLAHGPSCVGKCFA